MITDVNTMNKKNFDLSTLGKRLAKARNDSGLTMQELGERIGVSKQAVYQWEKDKRTPDASAIESLAEVLGVGKSWMLWGESNSGKPESTGRMIEVSREELAELDRSVRPHANRDFFITISDADSGEIILGYPPPPGAVVVNSIDIAIRPKANFGNIKDTEEVSDTVDHRN